MYYYKIFKVVYDKTAYKNTIHKLQNKLNPNGPMLVVRENNPLFSQVIMISLAKVIDSERTTRAWTKRKKRQNRNSYFTCPLSFPPNSCLRVLFLDRISVANAICGWVIYYLCKIQTSSN
jgi:hypothetical protein